MSEFLRWFSARLSTRRCRGRGCPDDSPHSVHLTAFGQWNYIGRWKP